MPRKSAIMIIALVTLAGCGPTSPIGGYPAAMFSRAGLADQNGQVFSYTHFLSLAMPRDSINPRFERARDRCLHDKALACTLISAAVSATDGQTYSNHDASLVVALPHDKIAVFEKAVEEPLPKEAADAVTVLSRSTNAENVTNQAADIDHKIAQLTSYRDSLLALSKRGDLGVSDLMKVDAELSKVQGDLDAALAQKRDMSERIAKEQLTVSFNERPDVLAPITRASQNALNTLVASTGHAIEFLIGVVPWLPIVAAGVWLLSVFWRWFRRKKPAEAK